MRELEREEWEAAKRKKSFDNTAGLMGMGLDPSPDDFRATIGSGSLLTDTLASAARLFLK